MLDLGEVNAIQDALGSVRDIDRDDGVTNRQIGAHEKARRRHWVRVVADHPVVIRATRYRLPCREIILP